MLDFETSKFEILALEIKFVEINFFLENYVTSEGSVSHTVLKRSLLKALDTISNYSK